MYNVYTLFMEKINKMHWLAYKRSAQVQLQTENPNQQKLTESSKANLLALSWSWPIGHAASITLLMTRKKKFKKLPP